jgi:hypothetical protein
MHYWSLDGTQPGTHGVSLQRQQQSCAHTMFITMHDLEGAYVWSGRLHSSRKRTTPWIACCLGSFMEMAIKKNNTKRLLASLK